MQNEDKEWLDYRARFAEVYDEANYSNGLQSWVMHAGHQHAERQFRSSDHFERVLEIGAGTGEHLPFVRHGFDQYVLTDLDNRALDVARRKHGNYYGQKLLFETQPLTGLSYADSSFDRLVATHVLEHIYYPHLAIKEWMRVVKDGGVISVLIPTDPGIAWRIGRHFGPRKAAIRDGIAYDYVMAREHVNSCNNLVALLQHYLPHSTQSWWPTLMPSIDLNFFFALHATIRK